MWGARFWGLTSCVSSTNAKFREFNNCTDTLGDISERCSVVRNVFRADLTKYGIQAFSGVTDAVSTLVGRGIQTNDRHSSVCSLGHFCYLEGEHTSMSHNCDWMSLLGVDVIGIRLACLTSVPCVCTGEICHGGSGGSSSSSHSSHPAMGSSSCSSSSMVSAYLGLLRCGQTIGGTCASPVYQVIRPGITCNVNV